MPRRLDAVPSFTLRMTFSVSRDRDVDAGVVALFGSKTLARRAPHRDRDACRSRPADRLKTSVVAAMPNARVTRDGRPTLGRDAVYETANSRSWRRSAR